MHETSIAADAVLAGAIVRPGLHESIKAPRFGFKFECLDKDGNVKWSEEVFNTVTTEGKNSVLDVYFDAALQITAWYLGLKGTGSAAAGDTLASHAGWAEVTPYAGNRPAITFGEPSAGSLAASAAVSYSINATATVAGAFIASVNTGTAGVLYSAGDFAASRSVASGDTLNVTPTVSFS